VLGYELGGLIEPRVGAGIGGIAGEGLWLRCASALVIDRDGTAMGVGPNPPRLGAEVGADGRAEGGARFACGELTSATGEAGYVTGVRRVLEAIGAGDVYQANLTHVLGGTFAGSARGLFVRLLRAARPWYGAYVEVPGRAVVSASPELFLSVERGGRGSVDGGGGGGAADGSWVVRTRPMKGTRSRAEDIGELLGSAKERAELTMIVDLMRNDLGRVCEAGSVRVEVPRGVEAHAGGGIFQATAQVRGVLREGVGLEGLLRATFPPGSVTGAPKVRAMELIRSLEPVPRGVYCGAIGYVSDCGRAQFSVAIRTAEVRGAHERGVFAPGGELRYGVGAGIVADSDPGSEWRETLAKAGVLRSALGV